MTTRNRLVGRTLAGVGVAGLALTALAGIAAADPIEYGSGPGQPEAPTSGTLNIHKFVGVDAAFTGTGAPVTISDKLPLGGVTFTAYPITSIDLADPLDWELLNSLSYSCGGESVAPEVTGQTVGAGTAIGPTSDAGLASASLAVGAYLVCETGAPANVTEKSAPFIVTVPMPAGANGWRYDIHAYPKNLLTEGETGKTVDDAGAVKEGDAVSWTVTSKNINAPLSTFVMSDVLDGRLKYVADSMLVEAHQPGVTGATDVTSSFTTAVTGANATTGQGGTLTATATSFTALNALKAGYYLTFTFETTVHGIGTITNLANVGGFDTNTAQTLWGAIEITKSDAANASKLLNGAEFEIRTGECGATDAVLVDTITTGGGTPAVNGVATSTGLKAGTYCVKETKAPAGYTGTFKQTVDVAAGATAAASTKAVSVTNTQKTVPGLPVTGANGTMLMTMGGIAIIAIGGGIALASRSRRKSVSE
ncbi:SpaH/EbpB family LPXTG-anchored major pilin [Actinomyces minihominis]|uniref:SpaH/EbpB family LPXTG-anchored major pilin n=1 Tax=Actinomyces minihominis TaxID=2002838 RepID=UPI000C08AC6C|nr:SpaH/EbpB family LPXTG-anchored major pilin [Actinomyces minihominis]